MIVFVEGIDRVGKTTLVNKLKDELKYEVFNMKNFFPYDNASHNIEILNAILEVLNHCKERRIVFDRFHMTELVYGLIERKYIGAKEYEYLNSIIEGINDSVLVLVEPTDVKRSSREHGKNLSKHDKMFKMLFECYNGMKVKTNYEKLDDAVLIIKVIEAMIEGKKVIE